MSIRTGFAMVVVVALAQLTSAQTSAGQPAFAQPPAGQQLPRPTFETGVDLISVDVHVVDRNCKPIVDLKP